MAEGAGFKIIDIGVDSSLEKFMEAVEEHEADIVGMSALLTTTMPYMAKVIDGFADADMDEIVMCVGGAPVSQVYAEEIGADGYGADAPAAVDMFKRLRNLT